MKLIGKIKNMSRRTGAVFMAVAMLLAGLAVGMGIFTNAAIARNIPIMRYGIRSTRTLLRNPIFT